MAGYDDIRELMAVLHRIQQRLEDLRGRLRRGSLVVQAQENNVKKAAEKLEKCRENYKRLQIEANAKEQQMAAAETAIAKRKTQLAEAKSNKEYSALKSQIAADEAANSVLADETLETIDKAEKFKPSVGEAEAELQRMEEQLVATKRNVTDEEPLIKADIAKLEEELHTREAKLPQAFHDSYTRLVKSLGGHEALALIANQKFCAGCNQQVPINSLARILQQLPVTCSSCGRLLYVPEGYVFDRG